MCLAIDVLGCGTTSGVTCLLYSLVFWYFPIAALVFSGLCIVFFHFFYSGGLATMTYDECQNWCLSYGE